MHSLFEYFSGIYSFFFCTSHDITYQSTIRSHTTAAGWWFVSVCKHNATLWVSLAFIVHLVRWSCRYAHCIAHFASRCCCCSFEMNIRNECTTLHHWGHICMCTFDGVWPRVCCCLRSEPCTIFSSSVSVFNSAYEMVDSIGRLVPANLCQPEKQMKAMP